MVVSGLGWVGNVAECLFKLVSAGRACRRRFFFQAEDGIRDVERSRGLGDVYKRQFQKGPYMLGRKSVEFLERVLIYES